MTRRRRLATWAIAALALVGFGVLARLLLFGHLSTESHDLHLQVATLDVSAGPGDTILSARGMAPGDVATGVFTVTNSSRTSFTYAMHHAAISADSVVLADGTAARDLAGATAEILCFRAELPFGVGNGLQGTATTVRLSFAAHRDVGTP